MPAKPKQATRDIAMSSFRGPAWLSKPIGPRVLPLEWVALLALLLLTVALTRVPVHYDLPMAFKIGLMANFVIFSQIVCFFIVLYTIFLFVRSRKGARLAGLRAGIGSAPFSSGVYWTDAARMVVALGLVLSAHFLVKISIHIINPLVFDAWLWRYDHWLGFGNDPVLMLVAWIHQGWLLHLIDYTYSVIYPSIFTLYVPILGLTSPTRSLRVAAITGFCLLWVVGGMLYVAFPSWGPVYTQPHHFEQTLQSMPITVHVQSELFRELKGVIENPDGWRPVKYGGVAAFPSLHLAVITLFVLASWKINRYWSLFNLALAAVMFVGSLVTGYHYLLDSLSGIVMGVACYHGALRWTAHVLSKDRAGKESSTESDGEGCDAKATAGDDPEG
jgi:hypothetical protein